jgi:hypothetical protein
MRQFLSYLQQHYGPEESGTLPGAPVTESAARASAARLAWLALAQNPSLERGLIHDQGILLAPLDPASLVAGDSGQTSAFLRLTFDLEGAQ